MEVSLERVEQVPLQSEPRDPETARGAQRRESLLASQVSISGQGAQTFMRKSNIRRSFIRRQLAELKISDNIINCKLSDIIFCRISITRNII